MMQLVSDTVIDAAYAWVCRQRRDWPADTDIWDLRFRWGKNKPQIQSNLTRGVYRFSPMDRVTKANGEVVHVWSSRDALVLKALSSVLAKLLPVSDRCTHVKGHGGAKAAVRAVASNLGQYSFVMRTDVKSYYDSIDQHRMLEMLAAYVKDRSMLNLLWQALRRCVTWGGLYKDCEKGISRGCPLSPLLGAFFLHELDKVMAQSRLFYVRFMDDILVLAPRRWKLRRAVKVINEQLHALDLQQHPDKTFIGSIDKGFDFLGYHFSREGLAVAQQTITNFVERLTRLYEQSHATEDRAQRLGDYVRRWVGWVQGGLKCPGQEKPRRSGVRVSAVEITPACGG